MKLKPLDQVRAVCASFKGEKFTMKNARNRIYGNQSNLSELLLQLMENGEIVSVGRVPERNAHIYKTTDKLRIDGDVAMDAARDPCEGWKLVCPHLFKDEMRGGVVSARMIGGERHA